jgi:hypothetical membrane protein
MVHPNGKMAGVLFFVAVTQFVLCFIVAEALYPGYSVSDNYISDLGVGPSSLIFNSSIFLLGLLSIIGAYFLPRVADFRVLTVLLVLMAVGAMGAGVFTKDFTTIHGAVSSMAFMFGGLSAIASFKVLKTPLSVISVMLGLMTLGALALFACMHKRRLHKHRSASQRSLLRYRSWRNGTHDRLSSAHLACWIQRTPVCSVGEISNPEITEITLNCKCRLFE